MLDIDNPELVIAIPKLQEAGTATEPGPGSVGPIKVVPSMCGKKSWMQPLSSGCLTKRGRGLHSQELDLVLKASLIKTLPWSWRSCRPVAMPASKPPKYLATCLEP
jgi:hypothetical protein